MNDSPQSNRIKKQQQNDYLLFLQKVRQIKKAELTEYKKKLASEKSGIISDSPGSNDRNKQKANELNNLILAYYSNLDEPQKKSVEKTLSIHKSPDDVKLCSYSPLRDGFNSYTMNQRRKKGAVNFQSYSMSMDRNSNHRKENNYTSEEYGNWLKSRPCTVSDESTGNCFKIFK